MSDTAKDQAIAQVESIARMVAALDLDYDRLQELRDDFEAFDGEDKQAAELGRNEFDSDVTTHVDGNLIYAYDVGRELAELESIASDFESADDAQEAIQDDPLSVEVRSDWCAPGETMTAGEFRIVLCTGGPHVELVGDLDQWSQPSRVRVIYKDWGESGELFDFDHDAVLRYCQQFYFGE